MYEALARLLMTPGQDFAAGQLLQHSVCRLQPHFEILKHFTPFEIGMSSFYIDLGLIAQDWGSVHLLYNWILQCSLRNVRKLYTNMSPHYIASINFDCW